MDSLNVHRHDAFTTIVFSDTILVYNRAEPKSDHDHEYLVMFGCEFFQDLLYRTIGTGIHFRAVLLHGEFQHERLKRIERFFGEALIDAYGLEKAVLSTGLFIHESALARNKIFPVSRYSDDLSFVYVNQSLQSLYTYSDGEFPIAGEAASILGDTDVHWRLVFDIRMLQEIYENMRGHTDPKVRAKFLTAWDFFMLAYPELLGTLVENKFSLQAISPDIDWSEAVQRVPGCNQ
ncbi:MAG TPA: hypothetical protein VM328_12665 [Fimbriimonadaceae bacterium]|nr:hypothetical protein [Fimbriimonadaceae bacterium]